MSCIYIYIYVYIYVYIYIYIYICIYMLAPPKPTFLRVGNGCRRAARIWRDCRHVICTVHCDAWGKSIAVDVEARHWVVSRISRRLMATKLTKKPLHPFLDIPRSWAVDRNKGATIADGASHLEVDRTRQIDDLDDIHVAIRLGDKNETNFGGFRKRSLELDRWRNIVHVWLNALKKVCRVSTWRDVGMDIKEDVHGLDCLGALPAGFCHKVGHTKLAVSYPNARQMAFPKISRSIVCHSALRWLCPSTHQTLYNGQIPLMPGRSWEQIWRNRIWARHRANARWTERQCDMSARANTKDTMVAWVTCW